MLTRMILDRNSKLDLSREKNDMMICDLNAIINRRYMLQPRNVIPIPDADEAKGLAELNPGLDVLALYPGTTCFYRAKVIASPSKVSNCTYMLHIMR